MINFDWQRDYRGNLDWLQKGTALLTVHGSHAYGLATETSDIDIKGIAVPPEKYFLGFLHRFEQAESKNPDMTIYDIRKFFQLAADCNPNIIEVLWTEESDIISMSDIGSRIRWFRDSFLSQKAKYTFSGYAIAQLKRIKTHKKWLLNPPKAKPTRGDFGLPESSILSPDILGAVQSLEGSEAFDEHVKEFGPLVMEAYQKERSYHNRLREWQQYENWKRTRNPARAELEAKHGLDTKHAMHLVRLMRMCREILVEGKVIVKRPDREELLAIRNGAWSYDELIGWADRQDTEMDELLKASPLPRSADRVYLDSLCQQMVKESLGIEYRFPLTTAL